MNQLNNPNNASTQPLTLFDRVKWRDPTTGQSLEPIVSDRTPAGVPISGALRLPGTSYAYPIVDCIARMTTELAHRYGEWLAKLGFEPPPLEHSEEYQPETTVDSFGWQWTWNSTPRTDEDLKMRVADKFKIDLKELKTGSSWTPAPAPAINRNIYCARVPT